MTSVRLSVLRLEFTAILLMTLMVFSVGANDQVKEISGQAVVNSGDSFWIDNVLISLGGIDAPELDQICHVAGEVWACGQAAKSNLEDILYREIVSCSYAEERAGAIFDANCLIGGSSINRKLVEDGWAIVKRLETDQYIELEDKARNRDYGIWRSIFVSPDEWRNNRRSGHYNPDAVVALEMERRRRNEQEERVRAAAEEERKAKAAALAADQARIDRERIEREYQQIELERQVTELQAALEAEAARQEELALHPCGLKESDPACVMKRQFGESWPISIPGGVLGCDVRIDGFVKNRDVSISFDDVVFALNDSAIASGRYQKLEMRKSDPGLVERGLKLCEP